MNEHTYTYTYTYRYERLVENDGVDDALRSTLYALRQGNQPHVALF